MRVLTVTCDVCGDRIHPFTYPVKIISEVSEIIMAKRIGRETNEVDVCQKCSTEIEQRMKEAAELVITRKGGKDLEQRIDETKEAYRGDGEAEDQGDKTPGT